ncbi:MAG: hypothetical protein ACR2IH_00210 [Pyrinomonadaceae bacterium]
MQQKEALEPIEKNCVVPEMHLEKGRTNAISPKATALRNFLYGRIRVDR